MLGWRRKTEMRRSVRFEPILLKLPVVWLTVSGKITLKSYFLLIEHSLEVIVRRRQRIRIVHATTQNGFTKIHLSDTI